MKNNKKLDNLNSGQSLITLVIFMTMSVIIVSAAVALIVINTRATGKFYLGTITYNTAEAGIENALLRLLRDPDYTGETMTIGSNTAVIDVVDNGNDTYTVTSVGQSGGFLRKIRVDVSYNSNIMNILSWNEE